MKKLLILTVLATLLLISCCDTTEPIETQPVPKDILERVQLVAYAKDGYVQEVYCTDTLGLIQTLVINCDGVDCFPSTETKFFIYSEVFVLHWAESHEKKSIMITLENGENHYLEDFYPNEASRTWLILK